MSLTHSPNSVHGIRRHGRMRLGEDILLARHGDNIASLRLDRRANRMVATLRDGSIDCASNSVLAAVPSPMARLGAQLHAVRTDTASVSRSDARALIKFSLVWLLISVVLTVGVIWAVTASGNAEMVNSALMYPAN
ncbi:hypothetical protein J2W21_002431 [Sinomonas atrocyanea]|uniref:hypothetical protein n=1 Tax=Sinomonas atrocyanea TaxID=37927 RepID=UPI0027853DDA|nr:hypothetical protein [Sinomonas atrocyanea]MDP9884913.1 hypothetical protein [Sinomonas atrocyanea]